MHPDRPPARTICPLSMSSSLSVLWSVHAGATLAMAGALWVVQLAVYPLFGAIGPDAFRRYHQHYTKRIGLVVGPLMLLEAVTAALLWLAGWQATAFAGSLALLGVIWLSTFTLQVPLHRRLADGYDATRHHRLVRSNWIRTLAWTARAALVLAVSP